MRFVLRRLGFFVLTLWAALTLNFFLPRLMPGNPAQAMIAKFHGPLSPPGAEGARGPVRPQHPAEPLRRSTSPTWATSLTGNFGTSLYHYPAARSAHIVLAAIWWTLGLVGITTILAFILGTCIGIIGAWRRGGRLDSIMPPVFVITPSIPYFWLGMMLILIFGVKLHWLPYIVGYDITLTPALQLDVHQQRAAARDPARPRRC